MFPFILPWWKLAAGGVVLVALAGGAWKLRHNGLVAGRAEVQTQWTAEKLATSETARLREQAAQKTVERVDREYQIQKSRLAADGRANADKLRDFKTAISADTKPSTTSGADDPYPAIASQCASALGVLDEYAKSVAGKATALQDYTREVCLVK